MQIPPSDPFGFTMTDRIGDKYAFFQLIASQESGNVKKTSQWKTILSGIMTGDLKVGARTPVLGMPVWATPEVARGGFATGDYAAGGALLPHEKILAEELGIGPLSAPLVRQKINRWFLTADGVNRLKTRSQERRFQIAQPEEAALMVVALLAESHHDIASDIVLAISPFFDRLRFYPRPLEKPLSPGICVRTVDDVRQSLAQLQPRKDIKVQAATLNVWLPLYDRLIDLIADPKAAKWKSNAKRWVEDYLTSGTTYQSKRWSDPDGPFQRCRQSLERLVAGKSLARKDLNYLSLVIERHRAKHGQGGQREDRRQEQAKQNVAVWFDAVADVVLDRMKEYPGKDGLTNPAEILFAVSEKETKPKAPLNADLPSSVHKRVLSAKKGTIDELIVGGQIQSPEVLAKVLPQMTSAVHASGFEDQDKAAVFSETYKAFHNRRSLLLLNLESQVRIEEIPWIEALLKTRSNSVQNTDLSKAALTEFVSQTLTHFPHVQFPNPLIEQMQDLAKRADLKLPFVTEIAADIFMGRFSPRFERAAQITAEKYKGTLYGRYYNLPKQVSNGSFDRLCLQRAGKSPRQGFSVAYNGTIIEQALILTSHNMAGVFSKLDLSELDFEALALKCFSWVCDRLELAPPTYHSELISLKNSAYAWRQMVALMSELSEDELNDVILMLQSHLSSRSLDLQNRLTSTMIALSRAAVEENYLSDQSHQFLGWTLGRHPLSRFSQS